MNRRPIGENVRAERAASDAELAARKLASDREWRIAHGWPDPVQPEAIPDLWSGRRYICDVCQLPVIWTVERDGRQYPTADAGKWRHAACCRQPDNPAKSGDRRAPRPVDVP